MKTSISHSQLPKVLCLMHVAWLAGPPVFMKQTRVEWTIRTQLKGQLLTVGNGLLLAVLQDDGPGEHSASRLHLVPPSHLDPFRPWRGFT